MLYVYIANVIVTLWDRCNKDVGTFHGLAMDRIKWHHISWTPTGIEPMVEQER